MHELTILKKNIVMFLAVLTAGLLSSESQAQSLSSFEISGPFTTNFEQDIPALFRSGFTDDTWIHIDDISDIGAPAVSARSDVVWIKVAFELPHDWANADPAIALGIIKRADQTYLNGTLIGETGHAGAIGTTWHNYPPILPRLYKVDNGLLKKDGQNVLVIKIARAPYVDSTQLLQGPIRLVTYEKEFQARSDQLSKFLAIDFFTFGIEAMVLLAVIFALALGVRDPVFKSFAYMFSSYFFGILEARHVVYWLGIKSPWTEFAAAVMFSITTAALLEFTARVFGHAVGKTGRVFQITMLAAVLSYPLGYLPNLEWWRLDFNLVLHLGIVGGLMLVVYWTVAAVVRQRQHAVPMLIGMGLLMISVLIDILGVTHFTEDLIGVRANAIGKLALQLSLAFILGQRILAAEKAIEKANANVLVAHEQERSRLARDIHDGVGQWLSTIKLNLQILYASNWSDTPPSRKRLGELITDVSNAIEDTRRIAHDLSPAFLEQMGLVAAMRSHADRLASKKNLDICVYAPPNAQLPREVRNHLYRIFQEALNNAVAHSQAQQIVVRMNRSKNTITLSIEDDGVGLSETSKPSRSKEGLGLNAMTERVRLLGGEIEISSQPDRGTRIVVNVKVEETL